MKREDVELYVMSEFDGDRAALEAALVEDPALRAIASEEAAFELLLRDAGAAAAFCVACGDLARDRDRCVACGAAIKPGGYTVEQVLVSNAHGRMYVARDADGTQVALKELAFVQMPSLETIAMFEREAKFLRALDHRAIPRFVASFEEGEGVHARYYLAQELVTGEPLDQRLENHFFTETEIIDIARQVLDVLVYLQTLSPMVIHRDIKPANLIAKADGPNEWAIAVVDFGAAHVQGATAGSTSIGTFGYMPIEQLAGQVDATTDTYALGASLLHLSSRREPWRLLQGVSLEGINVSPPLKDFLAKAVAPDPAQRFPNAIAAREALERAAKGERLTPIAQVKSSRDWVRPLLMAAAAIGLVAGGFGIRALMQPAPPTVADLARPLGTLRFDLSESMQLLVDGNTLGPVLHQGELPLAAGTHTITLIGAQGARCHQSVGIESGATSVVKCSIARSDGAPITKIVPERIPAGTLIDLDLKQSSLHDVVRVLSGSCKLNVVIPDNVDAKITANLKQAPCDQALEVILESHGLWYRYHKAGNIILIAPRSTLDREAENQLRRLHDGIVDDPLPAGVETVDFDFKAVPINDLLRIFADIAKVNIILPQQIDARVTISVKGATWDMALRMILESHGLWYRYRENGKLLRIAPRTEIDREDEDAKRRPTAPPTETDAKVETGELLIGSKPRAQIIIDGVDTERTTPAVLKLAAGKHRLTLAVDQKKWTWTVDIKAGEQTKVIKLLDNPSNP